MAGLPGGRWSQGCDAATPRIVTGDSGGATPGFSLIPTLLLVSPTLGTQRGASSKGSWQASPQGQVARERGQRRAGEGKE